MAYAAPFEEGWGSRIQFTNEQATIQRHRGQEQFEMERKLSAAKPMPVQTPAQACEADVKQTHTILQTLQMVTDDQRKREMIQMATNTHAMKVPNHSVTVGKKICHVSLFNGLPDAALFRLFTDENGRMIVERSGGISQEDPFVTVTGRIRRVKIGNFKMGLREIYPYGNCSQPFVVHDNGTTTSGRQILPEPRVTPVDVRFSTMLYLETENNFPSPVAEIVGAFLGDRDCLEQDPLSQ